MPAARCARWSDFAAPAASESSRTCRRGARVCLWPTLLRRDHDQHIPYLFVQRQGPGQGLGCPLGPCPAAVVCPGRPGAHALCRVASRRRHCAAFAVHGPDQPGTGPGRLQEPVYGPAGQFPSPNCLAAWLRPFLRPSVPVFGPWSRSWIPACAAATSAWSFLSGIAMASLLPRLVRRSGPTRPAASYRSSCVETDEGSLIVSTRQTHLDDGHSTRCRVQAPKAAHLPACHTAQVSKLRAWDDAFSRKFSTQSFRSITCWASAIKEALSC